MTRTPPRLALWLLRHLSPSTHRDALTGDLIEQFHCGKSPAWFWSQTLRALLPLWPCLAYALAGLAVPFFLGRPPAWLTAPLFPFWSYPWPWSTLLFDAPLQAWQAAVPLPALGLALALQHTFRWTALLRTWLLATPFLLFSHYASVALVPSRQHIGPLALPLFLSALALAAFLGCRRRPSPRLMET